MITLKEWMEIVDHRITEGSDYNLYSPCAYALSSWNGEHDGYSMEIIFDTRTQVVYCVEACDYKNNRAYRLINPDYKDVDENNQAWDDTKWVDLDVDDDFIQKCLAIKAGEDYDTRVQIEVDFDDAELLQYMKIAHDRDITFNQLVEIALQEAIDQHRMLNDIPFPVEKKKKKKGKK
jgi:hypothetical protein